jgi:hypothetical protein
MDNIGNETINKEFKIFNFFNIGLELSNDDGIELINNRKWIFNDYVIKNIKSMINIYLPKYTCAYMSNKLDDISSLYFGVDDFGNIKGIPYQGEINEIKIKNQIYEVINKKIKCETDNINILEYVDFELIKINYEKEKKINDIHPYYKKYLELKDEYHIKKEKYLRRKETWYKLSIRYNQKLLDLINNKETRQELINYIELISPFNPAIKLLKSDIIFECYSTDEILMYKYDYNSVFHWVMEWKDKMLLFIKSIRPKFCFKMPCYVYPTSILMSIDSMLPYWFKFNQNMNLYLIKFKIKPHDKIKIQYKNIYNEWTSCIRLLNENGPSCQHICYDSIYY